MYPNRSTARPWSASTRPGTSCTGGRIDQGIQRYSALCARDPACPRAAPPTSPPACSHTAAHMPSRWYFLPIKPGNVLIATFLGLNDETSGGGGVLAGPTPSTRGSPPPMATPAAFGCYRRWPGSSCPRRSRQANSQHRAGRRPARPTLFRLRRRPGLDRRQPVRGLLVGGRGLAHGGRQPGQGPVHQRAGSNVRRCSSAALDFQRRPRTPPRSCCRTCPTGTRSSCPGSGARKTSRPASRAPAPSC